ncbi:DsbA family protein [Phenylobacterium sp.]|uniref:DsbA family protein n=1 Tax=Phenylobacterium sp. TaxID=1871053 RepID=UPI0037847D86
MTLSLSRRRTLALAAAAAASGPAMAAPGVAAPDDMSLGNPAAKVKLVEYASVTCPHCAHFNATIWPVFKAKYVDTGRVHYVLKELPTPPLPLAAAGFLMARCAGSSKYFKVVDEVFRSQPRWQTGDVRAIFLAIAQQNGLTEAQFEACLTDQQALAQFDARARRAVMDDKVSSTPSFFVNGKPVSVQSLEDLEAAVAAAGG